MRKLNYLLGTAIVSLILLSGCGKLGDRIDGKDYSRPEDKTAYSSADRDFDFAAVLAQKYLNLFPLT